MIPSYVFGIAGGFGAVQLPLYLYHSQGLPVWQCVLAGLGIITAALLLAKRYGSMGPTV